MCITFTRFRFSIQALVLDQFQGSRSIAGLQHLKLSLSDELSPEPSEEDQTCSQARSNEQGGLLGVASADFEQPEIVEHRVSMRRLALSGQ